MRNLFYAVLVGLILGKVAVVIYMVRDYRREPHSFTGSKFLTYAMWVAALAAAAFIVRVGAARVAG